ncbi:MAG: glycerophosphodiester phosphodiesterase [Crocinitomicaceae bacterium]|jgi:glycerophosphoryl diester phosphodiesterase
MRCTFKLFVLLVLFSCTKKNYNSIRVFGHAGTGLSMENSLYHNNSKESVELCLALPNSDGVEVDVQMDNQGELWLYHDEFLDDISNLNGCVNDKSTSQMEQAYYKTIKKEKLVKLSQIAALINENQKIFLDIKNRNACSNNVVNSIQFQESLSTLFGNNPSNVFLILSDKNWIESLDEIYQVYYSTDNFSEGYNLLIENPKLGGIVIRNKAIEKYQIELIRSLGREVYLFDIRSPKGNRVAFNKNPNGIITDDIRAALIDK